MIDLNAFSPRNYTVSESKQLLPRNRFLKNGEIHPKEARGMIPCVVIKKMNGILVSNQMIGDLFLIRLVIFY